MLYGVINNVKIDIYICIIHMRYFPLNIYFYQIIPLFKRILIGIEQKSSFINISTLDTVFSILL